MAHKLFGATTLDAALGISGGFGTLLSLLHFLDIEVDVENQTAHGNGAPAFVEFFVCRKPTDMSDMNAISGLFLLPSPAPYGAGPQRLENKHSTHTEHTTRPQT